jgi:hypothetical protein
MAHVMTAPQIWSSLISGALIRMNVIYSTISTSFSADISSSTQQGSIASKLNRRSKGRAKIGENKPKAEAGSQTVQR